MGNLLVIYVDDELALTMSRIMEHLQWLFDVKYSAAAGQNDIPTIKTGVT